MSLHVVKERDYRHYVQKSSIYMYINNTKLPAFGAMQLLVDVCLQMAGALAMQGPVESCNFIYFLERFYRNDHFVPSPLSCYFVF